jgi:hypothetical protein
MHETLELNAGKKAVKFHASVALPLGKNMHTNSKSQATVEEKNNPNHATNTIPLYQPVASSFTN